LLLNCIRKKIGKFFEEVRMVSKELRHLLKNILY